MLQYDRFEDANVSLVKSINTVELVKGWQAKHLLLSNFAAMVFAVGLVASCTLIFHDLNVGFAAGSYIAAIEAVILAGLSLLGAVLS